jgi:hypothetical protein
MEQHALTPVFKKRSSSRSCLYISVIYQIPLKTATKMKSFSTESIFSDNSAAAARDTE